MKSINKATDIIRLGLHSLLTHKVRSLLTSLGIIIGVCSVIAMLAINEGFSYEAQKSLREMGSNNILIESVKPPDQGTQASSGGQALVYGLTLKDTAVLTDNIPGVQKSVSVYTTPKYAHVGERNIVTNIIATSPEFIEVAQVDISSGRFLNQEDLLRTKAVCILTDAISKLLFPGENPLGQTVRFNGEPFVVIGTVTRLPRSIVGGSGEGGKYAIVPMSSARKRFGKLSVMWGQGGGSVEQVDVSQLILQMKGDKAVINGAAVARQLLERTHKKQDYEVVVPLELIRQLEKQRRLWNFMFFIIASVSLLVGGIGIMNIMLASVTERTREIGIRRALGAHQRDIVVQFLVESVTLTTAGGLIGIGIGLVIPIIISRALQLATITTASTLILPFVMAVCVGLLSGLYPAMRAAKLDPIVALRHE